jgi:hypothetical protein
MKDDRYFFRSMVNGTSFPQDLTKDRKKKGRVFIPFLLSLLGYGSFVILSMKPRRGGF